ncbi:MAG: nucleoside-diphosphate kinase [Nanoarchaeota archaeon]|nr:nucleoside-diphosphate kinase [Nanoarchaeota archaeon]
MAVEQGLVLIKPDGVVKQISGDVMNRLADTGLHLVGAKMVQVSQELAHAHYHHLKDKAFFKELIDYIMGKLHQRPVFALVYEGESACERLRKAIGATNPEEAEPTSIRGKYGRITSKGVFENVVHASENPKEAEREIKLWFAPQDLIHAMYPTEEKSVEQKVKVWRN